MHNNHMSPRFANAMLARRIRLRANNKTLFLDIKLLFVFQKIH